MTVNGFTARHYKGNGFFAVNVVGYTLTHLIAANTGAYGVYAFNSKGGSMTSSEAYYNNDSGFYVGQTPRQTRPRRTLVKNVRAWGNVLGFSGTNMRYVTITKSLWWNNGLGIVLNALKSEKYPPPEDNVIIDNQVFWNNFDYFRSAPFKLRKGATGEVAYPVGTGILLFGSRGTRVERNQVYGNYLVGIGAVQQILLSLEKDPKLRDAAELRNNSITANVMNLDGQDINGRDLFYDGNGSGNCVAGNVGVLKTVPENGDTFARCPGPTPNHFDSAAQNEAVQWTVGDPSHEANWIRHPHAPKAGFTPLEHCRVARGGCAGQKKG